MTGRQSLLDLLVGASGFSLAGIGFVYSALLVTGSGIDLTRFNMSISLLVASAIGFLLLAFLLFINRCHVCVSAKKGVVVSLIFLSAGWAVWALGRLLSTAVVTFAYAQTASPPVSSSLLPLTMQQSSSPLPISCSHSRLDGMF